MQIISEKNLRATTSKVLFFIREDAVEYNFKPIFRSLLSSKQFKNEKCLKVWIWCLLKATDNDFVAMVGRQEVPLKRGQFIFGRIDASEELNMSQSTVWFWMKFLQEDGSINIKSNNKFSIISLSNIAKWDNILDSLLNNKKTTKRQQKDTYNKDNKEKKDNNNINVEKIFDFYLSKFNKDGNKYKLTNKRKLKLQQRIKDCGEDMLKEAIEKVANSKFHRGDNDRGWQADLDFIIRSYEQVERLSQLEGSIEEKTEQKISEFMKGV